VLTAADATASDWGDDNGDHVLSEAPRRKFPTNFHELYFTITHDVQKNIKKQNKIN